MKENPQLSHPDHNVAWKTRLVSRSVVAVVVMLWIGTALLLRPGIDFLLMLGVLLCGAGAIAVALVEWRGGRSSSRHTGAMFLAFAPMMMYAGIKLIYLPERAPRLVELFLIVLWLVAINHLRRVSNQEKAA